MSLEEATKAGELVTKSLSPATRIVGGAVLSRTCQDVSGLIGITDVDIENDIQLYPRAAIDSICASEVRRLTYCSSIHLFCVFN